MIVSIHQPMYLPWVPYITKLIHSDIFVVLDTVQYPGGRSFTNRNFVYQQAQPVLLTLPLQKRSLNSKFFEVSINMQTKWYLKHAKTIDNSYRKLASPRLLEALLNLYDVNNVNPCFTTYCVSHLLFIKECLGLNTVIMKASEIGNQADGENRVISILNELNAKEYITGTGEGSMRYLDTNQFEKTNIQLNIVHNRDGLFTYKGKEARDGSFIDLLFFKNTGTLDHLLENSELRLFQG